MENAVNALKLAFAVLVFVMALTITITTFNQAKATSDVILYAQDDANFYDYYEYEEGSTANYEKRVVGLETVIPTLYKYYKENYTVVFQSGMYQNGILSNVEKMILYESKSPYQASSGKILWGSYDWTKYGFHDSAKNKICSFDMNEETQRHEPWSGKASDSKNNLDKFLNGGTFSMPSLDASYDMNYGTGFIARVKKLAGTNSPQFVEELGEYIYETNKEGNTETSDTTVTIDGEVTSILRKNKKRVITYTLITN